MSLWDKVLLWYKARQETRAPLKCVRPETFRLDLEDRVTPLEALWGVERDLELELFTDAISGP